MGSNLHLEGEPAHQLTPPGGRVWGLLRQGQHRDPRGAPPPLAAGTCRLGLNLDGRGEGWAGKS